MTTETTNSEISLQEWEITAEKHQMLLEESLSDYGEIWQAMADCGRNIKQTEV